MHHRATPQRRGDFYWLAALVSLVPGMATAATVVAIDSGDTVRVREGRSVQSIRLACLDAPELAQAPHGPASQAALQMVRAGQAFPTLIQPSQCDPLRYAEAENMARFQ
jgi:endonuclease YncB( thermonuclease family)